MVDADTKDLENSIRDEAARVIEGDVWVFDVDGCVVDSLTGTSLRPGARELHEQLRAKGRVVVWWSAAGNHYARQRAAQFDLVHLVDHFRGKDERGTDGRFLTDHLPADAAACVFVDDRPEDLPTGARAVVVSPYLAANPHDTGLERALTAATSPTPG